MSTPLATDPRLAGCRRLFLRNFVIDTRIGVHDFEQTGPQRLLINVDLFVPLAQTQPLNDRLDDVLDYDFIRKTVKQRIDRGHINLQETLADDILALMLQHPKVLAARVSTEKPDVYPDCDGVGVEVFAFKDAFKETTAL